MTTREIHASYISLTTKDKNINHYEHPYKSEPVDKFYLIHSLFLLMGVVSLMPLSFIVKANSYWMHKFRNDIEEDADLNDKNLYQSYFSSGVMVFQILTFAFFTPITAAYGHKLTIKSRLFACLIVFAGCLCLCNVLIKVDITSCIFALFLVTTLVLTSTFPNRFLRLYLLGEGCSGIFTSILQIICLSLGNDPDTSAFIYFSSGIVILITTGVLLFLTEYSDTYQYYTGQNPENTKRKTHTRSEIITVVKQIRQCKAIFSISLILLFAVHPSLTALIVPENYGRGNAWDDIYFIPVVTFFFTEICGIGGRYFAKGIITRANGGWLILLSILRVATFIPLILFCNLMPRHNLPVIFTHDWHYILIVGGLAFTNGYIHNCVYLSIGKLAPENKELAILIFLSSVHIIVSAASPVGLLMVKLL